MIGQTISPSTILEKLGQGGRGSSTRPRTRSLTGKHIVAVVGDANQIGGPITLVINWDGELKK